MNIYLVRHAQSYANIDTAILLNNSNMSIGLTDVGNNQADELANWIYKETEKNNKSQLKIWNSPYERTRITAKIIKNQLNKNKISFLEEESVYLSERQFGLVEDIADYKKQKPDELKHYLKHKATAHDFFVRPPLGESPFDVSIRIDFFIQSILKKQNKTNHIIVTHGALIKSFIMMWFNYTYEDYNNLKHPDNTSVIKISKKNGQWEFKEIFVPSP